MKKYLVILALAMLPFLCSCEKQESCGTVTVEVKNPLMQAFSIDIYPYLQGTTVSNYPVYSKEFNERSVSYEVKLSPGNYIVDCGSLKTGINVIAGMTTSVRADLRGGTISHNLTE